MNKVYADSTLKSMTKDNLIEIIRCLESTNQELQDRINRQFKLLMEHELFYGWHDLRKNPDDVPLYENKAYLTAHKMCGTIGYAVCTYKNGVFDDCINPISIINNSVFAWKIIDWSED